MITAEVKYVRKSALVVVQLRYIQEAVTSLATSKTIPIARIGVSAEGNIATSPTIEKYPATADTARAEVINSTIKNISDSIL